MRHDATILRTSFIHLLLPFSSSLLVVLALLSLKRAEQRGASTWTSMILVCWTGVLVFPSLTLMGGTMQPIALLWQPALIGGLFLAGQLFTLLAVARGDVSIAAPVLGIKLLIVPALAPLFVDDPVSSTIWIAAAIAIDFIRHAGRLLDDPFRPADPALGTRLGRRLFPPLRLRRRRVVCLRVPAAGRSSR